MDPLRQTLSQIWRRGSLGAGDSGTDNRQVLTAHMVPGFEPCPFSANVWRSQNGKRMLKVNSF